MENKKERMSVHDYLHKKGVTLSPKTYFVDAMGAMALGLFASLLMATIFGTILKCVPEGNVLHDLLSLLSRYAPATGGATGAILGVAVAYALKAPALVMFASGVVGLCGNDMATVITAADGVTKSVAAGPAGAFICVLVACEIGKLVAGETKVDILVTPSVTILSGFFASWALCPLIAYAMYYIGVFVNTATEYQPILMGIVLAVVVGVILKLSITDCVCGTFTVAVPIPV